jgi:methyl-accepting chemotaxis protein
MDQSTQQNAALVEEIAAASESLTLQGRQLHTTVGFFKLEA